VGWVMGGVEEELGDGIVRFLFFFSFLFSCFFLLGFALVFGMAVSPLVFFILVSRFFFFFFLSCSLELRVCRWDLTAFFLSRGVDIL
jgi:hypothetical protein